ncbi:hypothetical protein DIPPA_04107 [Diplonema papillatum]|nr:hypothetical protein DIPPA_04107 [Diplonema papillatum]
MKLSATLPHSQNTFNDWLSELGGEDEWDAACADCGCTACKCGTYLSAFVRKKPPLAVRRKSEKNRRAWRSTGRAEEVHTDRRRLHRRRDGLPAVREGLKYRANRRNSLEDTADSST